MLGTVPGIAVVVGNKGHYLTLVLEKDWNRAMVCRFKLTWGLNRRGSETYQLLSMEFIIDDVVMKIFFENFYILTT